MSSLELLKVVIKPVIAHCSLLSQEMLNVDEFKCNPFAARIVELFSEDGSGIISFQKFINIFSVFSPRATNETKTVWAFAIWDFDGAPPAPFVTLKKFPRCFTSLRSSQHSQSLAGGRRSRAWSPYLTCQPNSQECVECEQLPPDSIAMPAAGDDLIGPRDIKRGVHLLTNAEMALLTEDAEAEEEPTLRGRRRRRDSGVLRGEKLTEEQITQVKFLQQISLVGCFRFCMTCLAV